MNIGRRLLLAALLASLAFVYEARPSAPYNVERLRQAFEQGQWIDDIVAAEGYSIIVNRPVLALFTGSDWCAFCKKLEAEVLSQSTFRDRVRGKYVLLYVDFPRQKAVPKDVLQLRKKLADQYKVRGYPTMVVLTRGDQFVGQITGFRPGTTAEQYMTRIEEIARAAK